MPEEYEFVVEYKEDIWKIPPETRILRINCGLTMHNAHEIVARCRELDRIVFSAQAFILTQKEVNDYLSNNIYHVKAEGDFLHHGVPQNYAKAIKELYARGDHNLHSLSLMFDLPKEKIWHIVHEKAPTHIERKEE